jgi:hypothetical protein
MVKMRLAAISCLVMLWMVGTALAVSQEELVEMRVEHLRGQLHLTDEQADTARVVIAQYVGQLQDQGGRAAPDPKNRQPLSGKLEAEVSERIGATLNESQREQLAGLEGSIVPDRQLLQLNSRLNLEEKQVPVVEEILGIYRAEIQAAMSKRDSDRRGMMGGMREIMDRQDESLKAVLSKDQAKELEKFRAEQRQQMQQRPDGRPDGAKRPRGRGGRGQ